MQNITRILGVAALWLREATGRRWFPDLRWPFLGFGVLMHLSIWAMMYVVWFTPLVLGGYLAFLRPAEVERLLARRGWRSAAKTPR